MVKVLEEMIKYKLYGNEEQVMELLGMLEEDRQTAKRGMRIWYEEEFAQIEAEHKKELSIKEAQYKKELAEKDESHAIELAEKDEKIAELNTLLKTNGIS